MVVNLTKKLSETNTKWELILKVFKKGNLTVISYVCFSGCIKKAMLKLKKMVLQKFSNNSHSRQNVCHSNFADCISLKIVRINCKIDTVEAMN